MAPKTSTLLFALLACLAIPGRAAACAPEQYYAPNDFENAVALSSPDPDFKRTQALAMQGNAAEQRSLAALYESGYLVSPCAEKAVDWYAKAAKGGDEVAKAWLERHARIARLRDGPECFGGTCAGGVGGSAAPVESGQTAVLRSTGTGMYRASVTVNGKSVRGLIDTGATWVAMSAKTAAELGIEHANGRPVKVRTANGVVSSRVITLPAITVEGITLTNVEAAVGDSDVQFLVGMSFLKRLSMSSNGGAMTLTRR